MFSTNVGAVFRHSQNKFTSVKLGFAQILQEEAIHKQKTVAILPHARARVREGEAKFQISIFKHKWLPAGTLNIGY